MKDFAKAMDSLNTLGFKVWQIGLDTLNINQTRDDEPYFVMMLICKGLECLWEKCERETETRQCLQYNAQNTTLDT